MRSIAARFSLVVGAFALIFSAITLYRAWALSEKHTEELTASQARLALEFDLAIREYAGEVIRPAMAERIGDDEFVVEAMSTSYIARQVMEKVRSRFPDYLIKFSSDNPRNPINLAGPEELKILQQFRDNPDVSQWSGRLRIGKQDYFARVSAMRTEQSCLRCHGRPEDSPQSLLDEYGPSGGFHRKVGGVAGMDMIAIPMTKVNAELWSQARENLLGTAGGLLVLFGAIFVAFRWIVSRRLSTITRHFRTAAEQDDGRVDPVAETGSDEISVLAQSFNHLADKLRGMHESLERQVLDRTQDLSDANGQLRTEIESRKKAQRDLQREQRLLKRSLETYAQERQVIAYEIHDGLAQLLAAALMTLEAVDPAGDNRQEMARRHRDGLRTLRQCLAETRRLIDGVRPPLLEEEGVVVAVENLLAECKGDYDGILEFSHPKVLDRFEPAVENAIYRVVQEGITNAIRYSQSSRIRVAISRDPHHVHVEVQDWGIGFKVGNGRKGGVGLVGIRQRASFLGGTAAITSQASRGTKITVDLPLGPRAGARDSVLESTVSAV